MYSQLLIICAIHAIAGLKVAVYQQQKVYPWSTVFWQYSQLTS